MAKKLYRFHWDCGRQGDINGLFVADTEAVAAAIGRSVYFGEVLGKHSDIGGTLEAGEIEVVESADDAFIAKLVEVIGSEHISGHNPLDYLSDEE